MTFWKNSKLLYLKAHRAKLKKNLGLSLKKKIDKIEPPLQRNIHMEEFSLPTKRNEVTSAG